MTITANVFKNSNASFSLSRRLISSQIYICSDRGSFCGMLFKVYQSKLKKISIVLVDCILSRVTGWHFMIVRDRYLSAQLCYSYMIFSRQNLRVILFFICPYDQKQYWRTKVLFLLLLRLLFVWCMRITINVHLRSPIIEYWWWSAAGIWHRHRVKLKINN